MSYYKLVNCDSLGPFLYLLCQIATGSTTVEKFIC